VRSGRGARGARGDRARLTCSSRGLGPEGSGAAHRVGSECAFQQISPVSIPINLFFLLADKWAPCPCHLFLYVCSQLSAYK
jgi:hypothetical protein